VSVLVDTIDWCHEFTRRLRDEKRKKEKRELLLLLLLLTLAT